MFLGVLNTKSLGHILGVLCASFESIGEKRCEGNQELPVSTDI